VEDERAVVRGPSTPLRGGGGGGPSYRPGGRRWGEEGREGGEGGKGRGRRA
jgi:hypothetical protein